MYYHPTDIFKASGWRINAQPLEKLGTLEHEFAMFPSSLHSFAISFFLLTYVMKLQCIAMTNERHSGSLDIFIPIRKTLKIFKFERCLVKAVKNMT